METFPKPKVPLKPRFIVHSEALRSNLECLDKNLL